MRKFASAVFAVGLVLGLGQPGSAHPTARPANPGPPSGSGSARPSGDSFTVTLFTGDRVTLAGADAARGTVAPGRGREGMRFLTYRESGGTRGGDLYVVPQDARYLIRAGKLDRRMFNVSALIRYGYHDAARPDLPLLVSYGGATASRVASGTLSGAGARITRDLPAIGGAAVLAPKDRVAHLWSAVTTAGATARAAITGGVNRIWLDGKRRLAVDHSVPQIGAPAAHTAGYTGRDVTVAVLDSGVDATHPDIVDKVADSRNFSDDREPADTVGHGTHVASIIAGSGAASGGKYRGVAPDATLVSGKVCESFWCTDSAMLAGLEWAAVDKRATVVNLSISSTDTPQIDPLEEAVNTLTERTGTLFVIAAGNRGLDHSVGSPGSADAALTVGAVDRDDQIADFSSLGPRIGDESVKPDLTAPGTGIVAARAANTHLGRLVGDGYVSASGTSMATPHVAGAVALLAQRHPDWTAERLKATLTASAKVNPAFGAFHQGAGRVDVARAITQTVTSDPVSISYGRASWTREGGESLARTVTYRNSGDTDRRLSLELEIAGPDRASAPAGMFTTGASTVTVPAGGEVKVTVTADTSVAGPDGYWTGRLVATGGGVRVTTAVGMHKKEATTSMR